MDVRAHYRRLVALRDMLDAEIEELASMLVPEQEEPEEETECSHPSNDRFDLGVLGDRKGEHWMCKLCDYEYHGLLEAAGS